MPFSFTFVGDVAGAYLQPTRGANYFLARGSSTQESKDLLVSALPDVPTIHPALIFPDEFVSSSVSIHLTCIRCVYS